MLLASFLRYAWHTTDGPGRDLFFAFAGIVRSRAFPIPTGTTVVKDQVPPHYAPPILLPHINAYAVACFLCPLANCLTHRFFARHL